jgi:hypothetical protein
MIHRFILAALLPILLSGSDIVHASAPQLSPPRADKNPERLAQDPSPPANQAPAQPNPAPSPVNKTPHEPPNLPPNPPPVEPPRPQANPAPSVANAQLLTFDTTELELVERASARKSIEVKIPARLDATDIHVIGWRVNQSGRPLDSAAVRFELQPGDGRHATLLATFDLAKLQEAGSYAVNVDFSGVPGLPDQTRVARASPSAPPHATPNAPPGAVVPPAPATPPGEQTVQFKITKPAAELRVSSPLKVERIVYLPWLYSAVEPSTLTLNETAGKTWLAPNPASWRVVLRKGEETPEEHALTVVLPQALDGWGQADAKVALEGPIGIGSTSGTLTIRAPQLAAHTADFPITVVSRFATFWVLIVIAIGILFGWLFRTVLESRRVRLEASIPGENEIKSINDLIGKATDDGVRQALQRAKVALVAVLEDDRSTPDAIKAATTAATTAREHIVKDVDDRTNAARKTLELWHWAAMLSDPLPQDVRAATEALQHQVAALLIALGERRIGEVETAVAQVLPDRARAVRSAILAWLDGVTAMNPSPWAGLSSLASLAEIKVGANSIAASWPLAAAITPELFRSALGAMADLLATVRAKLFGRGVSDVKELAAAVRDGTLKRWPQLGDQGKAIETALQQFPEPAAADTPAGVEHLDHALNTLWTAVHDLLQAAWANDKEPLPGLDEGRFAEALKTALAKKPPDRPLGSTVAPADFAADPLMKRMARPTAELPRVAPTWTMELDADDAEVAQPVAVRVRVVVPPGQPEPRLQIEWSVNGRFEGTGGISVLRKEFTFTQPGPTIVDAIGIDRAGVRVPARLIVNVARPHGAVALPALRKILSKVEHLQTWIGGVIITAAGWVMFSPSFIGTVPEFFAAFLWGFSVDIGAAKLRELSQGAAERKPAT